MTEPPKKVTAHDLLLLLQEMTGADLERIVVLEGCDCDGAWAGTVKLIKVPHAFGPAHFELLLERAT